MAPMGIIPERAGGDLDRSRVVEEADDVGGRGVGVRDDNKK